MNMNFDFKDFDLKNINIKSLLRQRDLQIACGVIVLSLIASSYISGCNSKKQKVLEKNVGLEEEKVVLGRKVMSAERDLAKALLVFTKKSDGENVFQDIASLAGAKVVSVRVGDVKEGDICMTVIYTFNLEGAYHNIGKFIDILESRKDLLARIESILVKKSAVKNILSASIVTSVKFINR